MNFFPFFVIEFQKWKDDVESNDHCSYVVTSGSTKNQLGEKQQYYQCNRSGLYKQKRKGKRRMKTSGIRGSLQ